MIGDDIAAALPGLRAQAESLMADAVTVKRQTGTTPDPVTFEEVPTFSTIYDGRARIQRPGGGSRPSETVAGEVEFGVSAVFAQLPLTATGIERGDVVTVTAVDPGSDPDLLGLVATVKANLTKTHPTKRTLVCEEVT